MHAPEVVLNEIQTSILTDCLRFLSKQLKTTFVRDQDGHEHQAKVAEAGIALLTRVTLKEGALLHDR